MAVQTYVVVGASSNNVDFTEHPERFEEFILDTLRKKERVFTLDVRPIGNDLATRRGDDHVRSVEFSVIEIYTPKGEFSILAQETDTNEVVRITADTIVSYARVSD